MAKWQAASELVKRRRAEEKESQRKALLEQAKAAKAAAVNAAEEIEQAEREAADRKRAHDKALIQSLHEQLEFEKEEQRHYTNQPVFFEGVKAFIEKRKPNFREVEAKMAKAASDKK